jgi:uncharacterized membrane protein YdfJ with MMPL/SSD domain
VLVIVSGGGADASQFQAIGAGLALGILMDTFLVRTVMVPSVVAILGRYNWWPSGLSSNDRPSPPGKPVAGTNVGPGAADRVVT